MGMIDIDTDSDYDNDNDISLKKVIFSVKSLSLFIIFANKIKTLFVWKN